MPPLPIPRRSSPAPESPEALYDTLTVRDSDVEHLWAHQADSLRAYMAQHVSAPDVALEFPTGAGKTLVGLLIGEWRRQVHGHPVAYVCPTNQLAHQAHRKAAEYGIRSALLIGSHDYWPDPDRHA